MGKNKFFTKNSRPQWLVAVLSMALVLPILMMGTLRAEEEPTSEEPATAEKPAQSSDTTGKAPDRRAEVRKKMMEKFDADGDGQLSEDERAKLRKFRQKRHGKQDKKGARDGKGPRDKVFRNESRGRGDRDGFGPPEGRGKAGKGRRGPRGHSDGNGQPNFGRLFEMFDKDGDDKLDRREFGNALHTMHEMRMQMEAHQGEGRRGRDHDGFHPGPPRGARERGDRDFRRGPPLERGPRFGRDRDGDERHFRRSPRPDSDGDFPRKRRPRPDRDLESPPLFPSNESELPEEAEAKDSSA
jgi:hypothetical protein